jgi:hypothetical protein
VGSEWHITFFIPCDEWTFHVLYPFLTEQDTTPVNMVKLFQELVDDSNDVEEKLSDRYHGPSARRRFFTRYRWHGNQRNITHSDVDAPTEAMVFDNESEKKNEFPFAQTTEPVSDDDSDDDSLITDAAGVMCLDTASGNISSWQTSCIHSSKFLFFCVSCFV